MLRLGARAAPLTLVLFAGPPVFTRTEPAASPGLYLLSGTPTEHSPGAAFPARLYGVAEQQKLKYMREVIPIADGLRFAYASNNAIYLIHPSIVPSTVTIVHAEEPLLADHVAFNPRGLPLDDSAVAIAEPSVSSTQLLIPLLEDASDPKRLKGALAAITANPSEPGPRVTLDQWEKYSSLRCQGAPGGPAIFPVLVGAKVSGGLAISVYGHTIVVDDLPPALREAEGPTVPVIIAASQEYLVVAKQRSRAEMDSPFLPTFTEEFVHVRSVNQWKKIRIEGSSSSSSLFGSWLATIVASWNSDHRPSPGRENERDKGSPLFPSVRNGYENFRGRWNWSPGTLTLQNLADGRKIRIETGQEDSEILQVKDDIVLYRVNDTIYQAKIDGTQLKDTTVVVKDEDVPEIHWAFWSK